jgi:hypothetical protein
VNEGSPRSFVASGHRQTLAPTLAPCREHLAAVPRRHARTKTMGALPPGVVGLIGTLHEPGSEGGGSIPAGVERVKQIPHAARRRRRAVPRQLNRDTKHSTQTRSASGLARRRPRRSAPGPIGGRPQTPGLLDLSMFSRTSWRSLLCPVGRRCKRGVHGPPAGSEFPCYFNGRHERIPRVLGRTPATP